MKGYLKSFLPSASVRYFTNQGSFIIISPISRIGSYEEILEGSLHNLKIETSNIKMGLPRGHCYSFLFILLFDSMTFHRII